MSPVLSLFVVRYGKFADCSYQCAHSLFPIKAFQVFRFVYCRNLKGFPLILYIKMRSSLISESVLVDHSISDITVVAIRNFQV